MKLWYQSLARQTESTPYGEILRKVIKSAADPGTSVHMQGVSESAGIGIHYRFLEYHDSREVIYNAIRAEKEGYDAFLIGNISDACGHERVECAAFVEGERYGHCCGEHRKKARKSSTSSKRCLPPESFCAIRHEACTHKKIRCAPPPS